MLIMVIQFIILNEIIYIFTWNIYFTLHAQNMTTYTQTSLHLQYKTKYIIQLYKIEDGYIRIRYVNKTTQDVIDFSTKTLSIDDTHTERFTTRHNINLM